MKHIVFTVTNDLTYDQRMQRICTTLAKNDYAILLIGRKLSNSLPLKEEAFKQKRLQCLFYKNFFFYAEYNLRLFFYLLFIRTDAICAIDLDTILPCYFVSALRNKIRIYDAHELFTEMKEVVSRQAIKKFWLSIEKFAAPEFTKGYTVSASIGEEFKRRYKVDYKVIRNLPLKKELQKEKMVRSKIILYQGAVNEARGLENLVKAMIKIDAVLHIYGDGNLYHKIKDLIKLNHLEQKVILKGKALPDELYNMTKQAYLGINLVEPIGLNQLYSLANKFFDYIQAGLPQLTMDFPEYRNINEMFKVAVLINDVSINEIKEKLNLLLNDVVVYKELENNCLKAREIFTWQEEEKKLLHFYNNVFA